MKRTQRAADRSNHACTRLRAVVVIVVVWTVAGCAAPSGDRGGALPSPAQPGAAATTSAAAMSKINVRLRQLIMEARAGAPVPRDSDPLTNADGTVNVSIRATVTDALVAQIATTGAQVTYTDASLNTIDARAPLDALEPIAQLPDVLFIVPKLPPLTRPNSPLP